MASIPWNEMPAVQRETAQALRGIREDRARPAGDDADGEEASRPRAAIAEAGSRAEVVLALEEVSAMVVSTRTAVYECSGRLEQCAYALDSLRSGVDGVPRGIRFWGVGVSLPIAIGAADEVRWLAALLWRSWSG